MATLRRLAALLAIVTGLIAAPASAQDRAAVSYASLGEAVAARMADSADDAVTCLAGAIYFEAKGEPVEGQLAVAEVIMNRAASGRFRSDVCGVVTQPHQFGFVRDGIIPAVDAARSQYRTARAIARVALTRAWTSIAPNALYFHARREPPSARWTRVAAIGNHVFYR